MSCVRLLAFLGPVVCLAACGGGKPSQSTTPPPGPSGGPDGGPSAQNPEREPLLPPQTPAERAAQETPPPPAATGGPPVTFQLSNGSDRDLNFATTKGWQPVLFAYTGKPPHAKSMLLFPTACTASCDAADGDRCPVCAEPKNKKEEEKMAKHETAAPGASVEVPWDAMIYRYEKTTAGRRKCQCWRKVAAPAGEYTVKACGLRAAKTAGAGSRPVCAESAMSLPLAAPPATITLAFPGDEKPPAKDKPKARKK
jgi:hypothetical protein